MGATYDFAGWATKNNIKCSDGRTIMKDAFKDNDGAKVPLIWNHMHDSAENVLGHALLENRDEGVYAYCYLNDSDNAELARRLVKHGDIKALSIYANKLKQHGGDVLHGAIREVSLVLAGANDGAYIDTVLTHSIYGDENGAYIYNDATSENDIELSHSDEEYDEDYEEYDEEYEEYDEDDEPLYDPEDEGDYEDEEFEHSDEDDDALEHSESDRTVGDVLKTFNDEQKLVMEAIVGQAVEEALNGKGEKEMKHNVFDQDTNEEVFLSHSDIEAIFADAKQNGSLKEAADYFMHSVKNADGSDQTYGVANIDYLFPDYKKINNEPDFISREMDWVKIVINGVHHTPFSRIKSVHADITMDEARAKGYIKGNEKKEEVFALLRRTTDPQTIYKKQKLDRDDIIDITDFNVVAWIKAEMRLMLDEEIARAILIGDGRVPDDQDKINESHVRPIYKDADLYSVKKKVTFAAGASDEDKAKALIKFIKKSRKDYKGSGNPTLFTTEDVLTDMLLIEDTTGRLIYDSVEKLKTALRVKDIVPVPVMEGVTREVDSETLELLGLFVNLQDYNVGADKGGEVNMFDDFDIDFNQYKYLIETRISGALTKPFSAIVFECAKAQG